MIRVLLVDDHRLVRASLRSVLDGADGVEVAGEAASGEEALAAVERLEPQLVLCDVRMPGLDGIELARQARRRYPGLNVLLVTAYVQDALGATDLDGTGIQVLSKPFNLNELIRRVETFLPQ